MMQAAVQGRRLAGKMVLFLVLCWLVVLISGVAGATRGVSFEPLNILVAVLPGVAFVPAAYFAVRLHLTSERAELDRLWPRTLVYGVAGLVLLFGAAYAVYRMGQP